MAGEPALGWGSSATASQELDAQPPGDRADGGAERRSDLTARPRDQRLRRAPGRRLQPATMLDGGRRAGVPRDPDRDLRGHRGGHGHGDHDDLRRGGDRHRAAPRGARAAGGDLVHRRDRRPAPERRGLGDAIAQVDDATGAAPAYYMVNCAHPTHFEHVLDGPAWSADPRPAGQRVDLSHAELDEATELDDGDPADLGARYAALTAASRAERARRLLRHRPPPRRRDRRRRSSAPSPTRAWRRFSCRRRAVGGRPSPGWRGGSGSGALLAAARQVRRERSAVRPGGAGERRAAARTAGRSPARAAWGARARRAPPARRCQLSSRTKTTPPTTAASTMGTTTVITLKRERENPEAQTFVPS